MKLNDIVEQLFTESGIPDIFFHALQAAEIPEDMDEYDFEKSIKAIKWTFIRAVHIYLLITSESEKIDIDLKDRFLSMCHEEMLRTVVSYYNKLEEIVEAYIDCDDYESPTEFFDDKIKMGQLGAECRIYSSYLYENEIKDAFLRLEAEDVIIRVFSSEPCCFVYENVDGERAYIPNVNLLNDDGLIDSQRYFFYELLNMLSVFQMICPIFTESGKEPDSRLIPECDDFIYFDKLEDLYKYSRRFAAMTAR